MTAASDPDILAGVERWARVRGWRRQTRRSGDGWNNSSGQPWDVVPEGDRVWVGGRRPYSEHEVSPALALAWALLVETDADPVDVGRCPACVKRGGPTEWRHAFGPPDEAIAWRGYWEKEPTPWATALLFADDRAWQPRRYHLVGSRPCPVCSGTGRETIPAARLLLDAVSGDATAHGHLAVHADRLQAKGDPRGELLALALGPWSGEPTRSEWFYASTEETSALMVADGWTRGPAKVPGVRLTHTGRRVAAWPFSRPVLPGTADALRWLEWLTWAREFEREREFQDERARDIARIGDRQYARWAAVALAPRRRPG
jgi:hypothetical protein